MQARFLVVGVVGVVGGLVLFACVGDEPATLGAQDGGDTDGTSDGATPGDGSQGCTTSATCPASAPTCSAGKCGACTPTSSDCAKFASTPVCGSAGACVECVPTSDGGSVSTECSKTPTTPFCGPNDTCVACLTSNDCAPQVCGSDDACRACQKNSECAAGACGDDGNCVAGSMIAYVDNGGMAAATCRGLREPINGNTLASAYCDIADALGTKPYLVVIGRGPTAPYTPFGVNLGASAETIIGPAASGAGAAVIGGSLPAIVDGASHALVVVTGPAVAPGVTIDGFEITSSVSGVDGMHCNATGTGHAMRVRNSYLHDMQGDGLRNANCDLTIEDSKISGTDIRAIEDDNTVAATYVIQRNIFENGNADGVYVGAGSATGVDLTFDRNIVANYTAGNGLQIFGNGPYRITNSFIYLNRYGVDFSTGGSSPVKVFQFNTLAYNANSAIGFCDTNLVVDSSIVVNNGDAPNSLAHCSSAYDVSDDAGAPAFVDSNNPSTYDFHLAVDTPAHTAANTACCIDKVPTTFDAGAPLSNHDYDGTARPKGAGYDIGAHEAK